MRNIEALSYAFGEHKKLQQEGAAQCLNIFECNLHSCPLVLQCVASIAIVAYCTAAEVLLFYSFGVVFTQMITDHCRVETVATTGDPNAVPYCNDADARRYFPHVAETMLSLLMAISAGVSWQELMDPLRRVSNLALGVMVLYIVVAVFAVLNVVAWP